MERLPGFREVMGSIPVGDSDLSLSHARVMSINLESLYHKDSTTSHPLNNVEPCSSGIASGWVTKYEYPVL